MPTTRQQLRRNIRQQRRQLSPAVQRRHALLMQQQICQTLWFRQARHIALYLPSDGEISPEPLIQLCWKLKKTVYLPVLHPILHNRLWFLPYHAHSPMRLNSYKIREPRLLKAPRRPAWALDLVCLPLVAFDSEGGRLGMGGGYYDRTFNFKLKSQGIKGPKLVGLAHALQQVDKLPLENWDVPLTGIATEKQIFSFNC
ncbi:MAG: 5-formyltetrahydrofolate cyclo-ligase [Nitrincola lacisaponensis]|uniref:5-formyltetrahydrofolate cyclo-ligase n=1 Tax=Nitrincola lacisaponensis TaxID=267850 RepID=A0A063Y9U3_9GAMM|nr:5-formyltetrahydrofolate cyclo-ligase [Nitrincola lacisaponensis]KDE41107.1 5-formyltetrahydrofolate cyclo-ligase [Nitrincola lacisaponensis]